MLGEVAAVAATVYLRIHWPAIFPYPGLLVIAVVIAIALQWDLGASILATMVTTTLANYYVLPPYGHRSHVGGSLALGGVGLAVSILGNRAAHARHVAEAAVQMRDEVPTLATHGMRAPLTIALGHVELLETAAHLHAFLPGIHGPRCGRQWDWAGRGQRDHRRSPRADHRAERGWPGHDRHGHAALPVG